MSQGGPDEFDDEIREVPSRSEDVLEEWQRRTAEPSIRDVLATKVSPSGWCWQVAIPVLEFVREDPLLEELLASIDRSLSTVDGVTQVAYEDREVFLVRGAPGGADLTRAAGQAVDGLSDRLREHYQGLVAEMPVVESPPIYTEAQVELLEARRDRSRQAIDDAMGQLGIRMLSPDEEAKLRNNRRLKRPPE